VLNWAQTPKTQRHRYWLLVFLLFIWNVNDWRLAWGIVMWGFLLNQRLACCHEGLITMKVHQEKPQLLICKYKFGSASVSRKQANFNWPTKISSSQWYISQQSAGWSLISYLFLFIIHWSLTNPTTYGYPWEVVKKRLFKRYLSTKEYTRSDDEGQVMMEVVRWEGTGDDGPGMYQICWKWRVRTHLHESCGMDHRRRCGHWRRCRGDRLAGSSKLRGKEKGSVKNIRSKWL